MRQNISAFAVKYDGPALPLDVNWGIPPNKDWVAESPVEGAGRTLKLPDYEGWYWFLGVETDVTSLAVSPEMVACQAGNDIKCYDAETGEQRWYQTITGDPGNIALLPAPGRLYAFANDILYAYDAKTSAEIWRYAKRAVPVAWGKDAVWTVIQGPRKDLEYGEAQPVEAVALLNATNTSEIKRFPIGRLDGVSSMVSLPGNYIGSFAPTCTVTGIFPRQLAEGTDRLAVKDGDKIKVFFSDGKEREFSSTMPYWPAAFAFTEDSLLVTEYQTPMAAGVPKAQEDKYLYEGHGSLMIARLINLSTGKEAWSYQQKSNEYSGWNSTIGVADGLAVIPKAPGMLCLDLQTGKEVVNTPWTIMRSETGELTLGDNFLVNLQSSGGGATFDNMSLYSLPAFTKTLDYELGATAIRGGLGSNMLAAVTETYPGKHFFYGRNAHLFAFKVDAEGKPVTGEMKTYGLPKSELPLVKSFYSNRNPLRDKKLMTSIVTSGVNGLSALLQEAGRAKPRQMDALVAVAIYIDNQRGQQSEAMPAMEILLDELDEIAGPALGERVSLWLDDESLKPAHPMLLGVLAQCGGNTAKNRLDAYYAGLLPKEHVAPKRPYHLPKPTQPPGRHEERTETASDTWSEFIAPDKARYVVFISPGLVSARDIYLGVDSNADGAFEEILPTGVSDTFFSNMHPSGIRGTKSKGPLTLKVEGDNVTIGHHSPVLKTESYDFEGMSREYDEITGSKHITSKVSLKAVCLDSDMDGLTDITERLLMLDPKAADTDGDGVADVVDFAPNANPAKMGALERGVQRALEYFFTEGDRGGFWWQYDEKEMPYKTVYLDLTGCAQVSYADGEAMISISLADDAAKEAYRKYLSGYNADSSITLNLSKVDDYIKQQIEEYGEGDETEMLSYIKDLIPPNVKYVVTFDFSTHGWVVTLSDIDGEFYPASLEGTWIS